MKRYGVAFFAAIWFFAYASAMAQTPEHADTSSPSPVGEVRVKVVYDQYFAKGASELIARLKTAAPQSTWTAATPDDLATELIQRLSKIYEVDFEVRLVPIRPTTNVILPRSDLTDKAYIWVLRQAPCDGANVMVGFTSLYLATAKNNEAFGESGNVYPPATFDYASGRMFVRLYAEMANPEMALKITLHNLDHEMRHAFGAWHPPGVIRNSPEEKLFFAQSRSVILANKAVVFPCRFAADGTDRIETEGEIK